MIKITPQDLFTHACQFGQKSSRWNPQMKKYIYGAQNGVHLFDLNQTAEKFAELLTRVSKLSSEKKNILFVSTKPHTQDLLNQIKEETGMPIVSYKWFGGLLTNFNTIKERIVFLKKLRDEFETGDITRYTKKEQSQFRKKLDKLELALGGVADMTKVPDAIFIVDGKRDEIALLEAKQIGIEVLGIADSNVNPELYDYLVPANDDSVKSLEFMLGHVVTAILAANQTQKQSQETLTTQEK
jgi:small subunit ribosomal protein S2